MRNPLGKPLYASRSEFDDEKFGDVIPRVLLPMALDYHVRSREIDVNERAAAELSDLNAGGDDKTSAVTVRITSSKLVQFFYIFNRAPMDTWGPFLKSPENFSGP